MTRFQVGIRCIECGHRYKRTMEASDEEALEALPDPPCPQCKKKARVTAVPQFDYHSGQAPAVGGSLVARAVDQTAQIVMEDHGLTDLRSDVREGETMVPKIPPKLQAAADNMFSRPKGRPGAGIFGMPPRAVLNAAVSGRFSTPDTVNPVAVQHAKREKAPIHFVNKG